MWLLECKTHGIHRVAPAADHPLQRETRRRRHIQMALTPVTAMEQASKSLGAEQRPLEAESTGLILILTDKEASENTAKP